MTPTEERTARLTVLIDPRKKAVFERICAAEPVHEDAHELLGTRYEEIGSDRMEPGGTYMGRAWR